MKGVENIYTQHVPRLVSIITNAIEGKLKQDQFAILNPTSVREKPQDIIVFMVGGCTFGEAMHVNRLTQQYPGVRVILGGTHVHNSKSFINEVMETVKNYKQQNREPKTSANLNTVEKSARLA